MRWLLLLLLLPTASGQVIVGVVPDLPGVIPGDEAFALAANDAMTLSGWQVSDGEGTWPLPDVTVASTPTWFVGNRTAWRAHDGPMPVGVFGQAIQLGNDGDQLYLIDPQGVTRDTFLYGDKTTPEWGVFAYGSPGVIYTRSGWPSGPWIDTDSADDWRSPRPHRVGESNIPMPTFQVPALTAYVSPDNSFGVLTELLASATQRIHLHVYDLRSQELVEVLAAAAARGVDVQVLVQDRPVGQDSDARHQTADGLQRIQAAGGQAFLARDDRYRNHHLKVVVVDGAVAIQSENWVASGVPEDPSWGNRGWGVVLHDPIAASWFATWMSADRRAWDTLPFDLAAYDPGFRTPPRFSTPSGAHEPVFVARRFEGPIQVTPLISPEHTFDPATNPLFGVMAQAQQRLWVQQLDFRVGFQNELGWSAADGLREALIDAGRRNVDARVQAAGPFHLRDTGNADAMAALPADGVAICSFERPDLVLHNKGVIADEVVYVGSMNGNHFSRSMNREVGVLIDDPAVADHFAQVFLDDWGTCGRSEALVPLPLPMLLVALLVAAAYRCCLSSPSSPSSPSSRR